MTLKIEVISEVMPIIYKVSQDMRLNFLETISSLRFPWRPSLILD